MKRMNHRYAAVLASTLASIVSIPSTQAALVTGVLGTTGWMVNFDTTQVTSFAFIPNPAYPATSPNEGTLTLSYLWTNALPISVTFFDTPAAADSFGLRITLNEVVSNVSGIPFNGFNIALVDPTTPSAQGGGIHPGVAHFHNDGTNLGVFTNVGLTPGTGPLSFVAGNATFTDAFSEIWTGIGMHEWEIAGVSRNFQLIESPTAVISAAVQEPGALALLGVAIGGLCGVRLRKIA